MYFETEKVRVCELLSIYISSNRPYTNYCRVQVRALIPILQFLILHKMMIDENTLIFLASDMETVVDEAFTLVSIYNYQSIVYFS